MQDEKHVIISDREDQFTYYQTSHQKLGETYKPSNMIIQNEELIQFIGYLYKNGKCKVITYLTNHIDLPRGIEYPVFNERVIEAIKKGLLYCPADASVEGSYMGGYWLITDKQKSLYIENTIYHNKQILNTP